MLDDGGTKQGLSIPEAQDGEFALTIRFRNDGTDPLFPTLVEWINSTQSQAQPGVVGMRARWDGEVLVLTDSHGHERERCAADTEAENRYHLTQLRGWEWRRRQDGSPTGTRD
ncbi:hypothetical protein [Fodinicola feengrottensis]|uniref:Uncharacterized protein n=1 Tax=Fodinicola feengrottensis TaxID=435914 RepID=A0ABN2FR54_9ACTN|nr:hypothetical protein [Fodinicola feengrottensis]